MIPDLRREAADLGFGLLVATNLAESGVLTERVLSQHRAKDPRREEEPFGALGRTDRN